MKLFLWPAKRQRKERIKAAVQHSAGIRAVRRIAVYRCGVDYAQSKCSVCMCVMRIETTKLDAKQERDSFDKGTVIHLYGAHAETQTLECTHPCMPESFHVSRARAVFNQGTGLRRLPAL
jgi:hypothetical protein